MRKGEDIGRDQSVCGGKPALGPRLVIIGNDQVEIEHQAVQFLLSQTGPVEQHGPCSARKLRGNSFGDVHHAGIDGLRQFGGHE